MAQNKQTNAGKAENQNMQPTASQGTDGSADDTELAAAGPQATAAEQGKAGEKPKQASQKTSAPQTDDHGDRMRKRMANGNGKSHGGDHEPMRRDRQIARNPRQDDDPGHGRQVRRDEDYDQAAGRGDIGQRNLFGDEDENYYDRRAGHQARDRGGDYDRGRRASQGYGHTAAHDDNERLSREYGSEYRRYSDAGYEDRNPYRSRDRAYDDRSPYGNRDRIYDEGGQYRARPQAFRPNDNGRDFEREAREQPRNRWREVTVDPRYDDAYDHHRNRAWSPQGNQDRHRNTHGRHSPESDHDEGRYRGQDRGYGDPDERGPQQRRHRGEPVAGNRSNYPAAREDDRGNPGRWRDERRDYRENEADDHYEHDRGPWRRR